MKSSDFMNLKTGDIIEVIVKGQNYAKRGVIVEIDRDRVQGDPRWSGSVYITPINCEFTFSRHMHSTRFKGGLVRLFKKEIGIYPYTHNNGYPKPKSDKVFYVQQMFGGKDISWPTENFTETELKVIERFFKEVKEHAGGAFISSVSVLDTDDKDDED